MTRQSDVSLVTVGKKELANELAKILPTVRQGDLISLGAITLVGIGTSAAWSTTAEHKGITGYAGEELWSLMIESDVGWYVIITQDCDIVREPDVEPALVVCPLRYVPNERWQVLRSGPKSPREFPFPDDRGLPKKLDHKPVADLRFITSVDKTALLHPRVQFSQPLSGPQRATFGKWVGERYARVPHSDVLERDVLPKAAAQVRKIAAAFKPKVAADPEVRLVAAAESWYIGGNDKRVVFIPMISEASARRAKLWDETNANYDYKTIEVAAKKLTNKIRASLPVGSGYTCNIQPTSMHGASAADLMEWSEWIIEDPVDPLN